MIKVENGRVAMGGTPHEIVNDWMCCTHELIEALVINTPFKRESIVNVLSEAFKDAILTMDELKEKMKVEFTDDFKEAVEESEMDPDKACELLEMVAEKIKNGEAEIKTIKREVK